MIDESGGRTAARSVASWIPSWSSRPRLRPGEVLFTLAGFPVALIGLAYVAIGTYACGLLALTVVGLPVLAAALRGARHLSRLHRRMLSSMLRVEIDAPAEIPASSGWVAWVRGGLTDPFGWRGMAYLFVRFPIALAGLLALVVLPLMGVWTIGVGIWMTTQPGRPPLWVLVVAIPLGLLAIPAVPWAVRGVTLLDIRVARLLIGPNQAQRQLTDLRRARSSVIAEHTRSLRRIEQDLHDGTQAELVAIAITLALAADAVDPHEERLGTLVGRARQQTDRAIAELRRLIQGIDPTALQDGLATALRNLGERSPVPMNLTLDMAERAQPGIERIAYFCVVEVHNNAIKHSGADEVRIHARISGGELRITVSDNGRGGARIGAGTGLAGLRERLAAVDGALRVDSPAGGPTRVVITAPTSI